YLSVSGTLTFPPGSTTQSIAVGLVNDSVYEPDRTFTVKLSNPAHATLSTTSVSVTIVNDEQPNIVISSGPTANPNPATVNRALAFSAAATGIYPIKTWSWDFGDNTSITAAFFTNHTYAVAGTYTVTLTLTDTHDFSISHALTVTIDPDSDGDG